LIELKVLAVVMLLHNHLKQQQFMYQQVDKFVPTSQLFMDRTNLDSKNYYKLEQHPTSEVSWKFSQIADYDLCLPIAHLMVLPSNVALSIAIACQQLQDASSEIYLKLVRNLVVAVAVKVKIVKFLTCRCNIC
jgi:hypothetical protein